MTDCRHCSHKAGQHTPRGGCMNSGAICGCTWTGPDGSKWALGFTPDVRDMADRAKLQHPESGTLEPGEAWGWLW